MRPNPQNKLLSLILVMGLISVCVPDNAIAGCKINYSFRNDSEFTFTIKDFQIKSQGGSWTSGILVPTSYYGFSLWPGDSKDGIYNALLNCNAKRKYRYTLTSAEPVNCRKVVYLPATGDEWTTGVDIDFGDVSRHCELPEQTTNESTSNAQPTASTGADSGSSSPDTATQQSGTQGQVESGNVAVAATPIAGSLSLPEVPQTTATETGGGIVSPSAPVARPTTTSGTIATATPQLPTATRVDQSPPDQAIQNSGQCMVTSTRSFPVLYLRCGVSVRDEKTIVSEDYLADCPLIAGDNVNVQVVEGQNNLQITGRASGGDWCGTTYQPGYYTGPCSSAKSETGTEQTKTSFYQGRKSVKSVQPNACTPVRLKPGVYRVIVETYGNKDGKKIAEISEGGLKLAGEELVGDVSGMVSQPITRK